LIPIPAAADYTSGTFATDLGFALIPIPAAADSFDVPFGVIVELCLDSNPGGGRLL